MYRVYLTMHRWIQGSGAIPLDGTILQFTGFFWSQMFGLCSPCKAKQMYRVSTFQKCGFASAMGEIVTPWAEIYPVQLPHPAAKQY
jgi:hypothetical protein